MILPIFMFSRQRNSMDTLSHSYHYRVISKIRFEPEVLELQGCPYFSNLIFEVNRWFKNSERVTIEFLDLENINIGDILKFHQ